VLVLVLGTDMGMALVRGIEAICAKQFHLSCEAIRKIRKDFWAEILMTVSHIGFVMLSLQDQSFRIHTP
jgi:hypothetical protein